MELPEQLTDAIAAAIQHQYYRSLPQDSQILDISIDDSFLNDGFGGAEIRRIDVTVMRHRFTKCLRFVVKRWNPSPWVLELTGVTVWLEMLLYDIGVLDHINANIGLHVPVIGSFQSDDADWIIMEDVSAQLASWKSKTEDAKGPSWRPTPDCLRLYSGLLDRIAHLHTEWESADGMKQLQAAKRHLMSQEATLRGLESLFREWFNPVDGDYVPSHAQADSSGSQRSPWESKAAFSEQKRGNFLAFLDRLSAKDRLTWIRHMQCRDDLVAAARMLPRTLLHGDINRRNIGLEQSPSTTDYILIDWEDASFASHAFDVVSLIIGKGFSPDEIRLLEEHYFERYLHHQGRQLDRRTWKRACDIAIAFFGLCRLPHVGELVRRGGLSKYTSRIEALTERAGRVLHDLGA